MLKDMHQYDCIDSDNIARRRTWIRLDNIVNISRFPSALEALGSLVPMGEAGGSRRRRSGVPSVADVARLAGVSTQTVSRFFYEIAQKMGTKNGSTYESNIVPCFSSMGYDAAYSYGLG